MPFPVRITDRSDVDDSLLAVMKLFALALLERPPLLLVTLCRPWTVFESLVDLGPGDGLRGCSSVFMLVASESAGLKRSLAFGGTGKPAVLSKLSSSCTRAASERISLSRSLCTGSLFEAIFHNFAFSLLSLVFSASTPSKA